MTPYSETLIGAMKTALEAISVANGYGIDVQSVQLYDDRNLTTTNKPCIHIHTGRERRSAEGGLWSVQLELEFLLYLFNHEQADTPQVTTEKRASEDVLWCLCNSVDWGTLKALLISQDAEPFVDVDEETTESGVAVTVVVAYLLDRLDLTLVVDPDRSEGP